MSGRWMQPAAVEGARHPLEYSRLTDPQRAFAGDRRRFLLWRGGNSIGKSYGNAWDCLHFARGTHPLRPVPPPPTSTLVLGYSFAQMDPLLRKIASLLPWEEVHKKVRYEPGQGFRGFKEPIIPFVRGPGRGSEIVFASYEQGSQRIMGWQGHCLRLDEPPPAGIWSEAIPRLNRYHGELRVTMTPTPESPPLEYLRKKVEAGEVAEIQTSLTPSAVCPRGGLLDIPWMTPEGVAEAIASYDEVERAMREHGSWDAVVSGRAISLFDDSGHLWRGDLPPVGWHVGVAIDHGSKPGRQYAVLGVVRTDGEEMRLWDEYWPQDERSTSSDDARGILAMLERRGLTWRDVDVWVGDRSHGGDRYGNEKSNTDLLENMAEQLGTTRNKLWHAGLKIYTPYKVGGSVRRGVGLLNDLLRRNQLLVHDRCEGARKGFLEWAWRKEDPAKDRVDPPRYLAERFRDSYQLRPRLLGPELP